MNEPAARGELLNKIEFIAIGRQDRQASSLRRQKDQRVVQTFLALMSFKILRSSQCAGDQARLRPNLCVGR